MPQFSLRPLLAAIVLTAPLAAGCDRGACDDVNSQVCALPWPSDRYLAEDDTTATGFRVDYDERALPRNIFGATVDVTPYARLDGMSPASQLMTMFAAAPDLELSGAASQDSIGRSLESDSPTVILDLETGERIAHWTELDVKANSSSEQMLYLRTARRLEENRGYGVAIRNLVDAGGAPVPVDAPFALLRDGLPTGFADLARRTDSYEELFDALVFDGVTRSSLQMAWRFHTASGESIRGPMLSMRDDAIDRLGADGLGCTITLKEDNRRGEIWRYVEGTITTPSYMTSASPPALLVRDENGLPVFQGMVEVPFIANIPGTLAEAPGGAVAGPLVTFGHGLLGTAKGSVDSTALRGLSNRFGTIVAGTDWAGMSSPDLPALAELLVNVSGFPHLTERLHQGMINQIALTRSLAGVCRDLPELTADGTELIDPSTLWYAGGSQGGIFGATLLALSPDIDTGALFVNGASFGFMMDRSITFKPFFDILNPAYPQRTDHALLFPAAQHLWDGTDPASYLPTLEEGLPGIGPKRALSIIALNDAQVPNLSSDWAARTAGWPVLNGSAVEPWGLELLNAPIANGPAFLYIDGGDPTVPSGNEAPSSDAGGHGNVPFTETSLSITQGFFENGVVTMPCVGVCDPD